MQWRDGLGIREQDSIKNVMPTLSEILDKVLITVTYKNNGQVLNEFYLAGRDYRDAVNDRIPRRIKTTEGTVLYGLIELPNNKGKYLATCTRAEYDSLYEYYITHKGELEQKEKERMLIKEQSDNWFDYRNPSKRKLPISNTENVYRPFICYHNAFESNRHKH